MIATLNQFLARLQDEGGLLRVRALLAGSLTGGGIAYLLMNQAMPPGEYNILWGGAVAYYFGTRGNGSS